MVSHDLLTNAGEPHGAATGSRSLHARFRRLMIAGSVPSKSGYPWVMMIALGEAVSALRNANFELPRSKHTSASLSNINFP